MAAVFGFTAVLALAGALDLGALDLTAVFLIDGLAPFVAALAPLGATAFLGAAFLAAGFFVPADFAAVFRRTAVFFSEMALILLKPT
ncbi:hypothetical protein [Dongia sp.]|uniref:hypothetical protein n=1 Tax=Dongia sp. TaxID=1977262 RepID=UPI0035AEA6AB